MASRAKPSLQSVALDLYGAPLEDFTKERNSRAKEAKDAGDAELAGQVRALKKPTASAWLVNQMARRLGGEVEQVLRLGDDLRRAQEDLAGEELRELDRQRRQLLTALTTQARGLGRELGRKITDEVADEVEGTLRAALTDEAAADAVRTGLLVDTFEATGFGAADLDGVVAVPGAISGPKTRKGSRAAPRKTADAAKVNAAREAVEDAEKRLEEASARRRDVQDSADEATGAADAAEEALRALRDEVRTAEREAQSSRRDAQRATKDVERAERDEESAERALKRARDRLARLG